MPIYEYRCSSCGHELEALQKLSDAPLAHVPVVPRRRAGQARVGRRLPAEGQRLVRDRLQGQRQPSRAAKTDGAEATRRRRREAGGAAKADAKADEPRDRRPSRSRRPKRAAATAAAGDARRQPPGRRADAHAVATMKRYLIAGLLVWVPLGITIWVLHFLVTTLDQTLLLVPGARCGPTRCSASTFRASASLLSFAILLLTGVIAANFFGARLIQIWEGMLGRIPFVKSIYSSVKQVSDTLLSDSGHRVPQGAARRVSAPGLLDDRVPDRHAGRRGRRPPARRARQRLRADDAQSDRRLLRDGAARARARARHDRRRGAEVHHLDGRRRAAPRGLAPPPQRRDAARRAARPRRASAKLTARERAAARRIAAGARRRSLPPAHRTAIPNYQHTPENRLETHRLLRPHRPPPPRPDRHADGLGPPPPRPRRRHLHRPARPRRPRAGRLRSRPRRRPSRSAETLRNEFVHRASRASCARGPEGTRQSEPRLRRDRGARARDRDPERRR